MNPVLVQLAAKGIGRTVGKAGFDTATGHPHSEPTGSISSLVALGGRRLPTTTPKNQGFIQ